MKIYFKIFETPTIIGEQKIFKKQPGQTKIKYIDLKKFNFECTNNVKVLDLNKNVFGAVDGQFINYFSEINKEYITKAFTFFENWRFNLNIGPEHIESLSKYPESFICKEEQ